MLRKEVFTILLSNTIALLNFSLLIYSMLLKDKNRIVISNIISKLLMLAVYFVSNCWSSVLVTCFSIGRDYYYTKAKKKRKIVVIFIILIGAVITFFINSRIKGENLYYLPVLSLLFYSSGLFISKNANQLKIVNAIDVSLWILYDYKNMLILCVVQDVFVILMSIVSQYLSTDTAENEK